MPKYHYTFSLFVRGSQETKTGFIVSKTAQELHRALLSEAIVAHCTPPACGDVYELVISGKPIYRRTATSECRVERIDE